MLKEERHQFILEKLNKSGLIKVEDLTEYEFNSEVHYFCEKDEPENINEINFSDKAVSAE